MRRLLDYSSFIADNKARVISELNWRCAEEPTVDTVHRVKASLLHYRHIHFKSTLLQRIFYRVPTQFYVFTAIIGTTADDKLF